MMTAMSAIELGVSKTYSVSVTEFRSFLGTTLDIGTYSTMNGYEVEISITDNDDGDNDVDTDLDLTLAIVAKVTEPDPAGNWPTVATDYLRQVRIQREVEIVKATDFNFASANFDGTTIYQRHWYGHVLFASPTNDLMSFNNDDGQTYHGEVTSLEFDGSQNNHRFVDEDDNVVSEGTNDDSRFDLGLHHEYEEFDDMPAMPDSAGIAEELEEDGTIWENKTGTIDDGTEIFLHPNGEIWTRDFGDGPDDWSVYGEQDGQTIVVTGNATIRGVVTGRLTIASQDTVVIVGNIYNADYTSAHLGLAAANAIFYENREVYTSSGSKRIKGPRPINHGDTALGGSATGSTEYAATNDNGTNIAGRSINNDDFNFISKPVFDSSDYGDMGDGNGTALSYGGFEDAAQFNQWEAKLDTYQANVNSGGVESIPGRMPKHGGLVEASMVSGWYISPMYASVGGDNTAYYYTGGGDFTVRGTYALGIGIDYMATWSKNGGTMNYEVHPYQQSTAPDYFLNVTRSYPALVYGSWKRLPDDE